MVPTERIRNANEAPPRPEREFVLYWMTASRRIDHNHAMDRAVEWAHQLGRPVLVFEALRCGYPFASDRIHAFVMEGMRDNQARLAGTPVGYFPYVEPAAGAGKGLLAALGSRACVVVTDDFPAFMLPRMTAAAARALDVRLEQVDSNGLYPMRLAPQEYTTAYLFRRYLQRHLGDWLTRGPAADALAGRALAPFAGLAEEIARRWPSADLATASVARLPIDHEVPIVSSWRGGRVAGLARLAAFDVDRYGVERDHPDADAASGLSAYLHFGHVSAHEVFGAIAAREGWAPDRLATTTDGSRRGWWGMSDAAEGFLDQLSTWRELGFNMCVQRPDDYLEFDSLPDWAHRSLTEHERDLREWVYSIEELEAGRTHDPIWNAAQNQLREEGRIHNYMRMLWGKKILEWSATPREALAAMLYLNDRWALDGRDPNSASGIFWVLGRYDRAWGPERPIYGKVRYMTSASAARKLRLSEYVARWTPPPD